MATRAGIPSSVWKEHKAAIIDLYINKNLKLSDVNKEMSKCGFQASNQQYTRQFQKWGLFKDLKEDEWQLISRKLGERKSKPSTVFVRGREISKEKLDRGLRRHVPLSFMYAHPTLEERDYIRVCTPVIPSAPPMNSYISNATFDELIVHAPQPIQQEVFPLCSDFGDLPTLRMADLLDQQYEIHKNDFYRMASNPLILAQSFRNEVLEVLRYCDVTFKLLGYKAPVLTLTLEELPQDSPWKRLGQRSNELQCSFSGNEPVALLQITKIIVSLVANSSLAPSIEQTFGDLIEMLQEVDPLERFLRLIADNNLYWFLMRMLKIKDPAIEIFANRALPKALCLGDRRLVQTLLDAEADPYGCDLAFLITYKHLTEESHSDRDSVQHILNAQLERDRLAFKSMWRNVVLNNTYMPRFKWYFTLILKTLVQLVEPALQEECHAVIEAVIVGNQQPFIDRSQSLRANCKQDSTFLVVFDGICKIATPKAATKALKLLRECNTTAFEISFYRNVCNTQQSCLWDEKDVLSLLDLCSIESNTVERWEELFLTAVFRDWLQVAEFFLARGVYLHRNDGHKPKLCRIHQLKHLWNDDAYENGTLRNREMLDLLLSRILADGENAMTCWLTSGHDMNLHLLKYTVQFWECYYSHAITRSSISKVLEKPEFLVSILRRQDADAILWLLSFDPFRNSLNKLLMDFPTALLPHEFDECTNVPSFNHSPNVLKNMLDCGLSPSRGLLVWCALGRSAENVDNLRLIVHEKSLRGQPFSSTDFSLCLDRIFKTYDLRRRVCICGQPCYCLVDDYIATRRAITAWKLFIHYGAICTTPILKLASEAQSSEEYKPICEYVKNGWHPIVTAIESNSITMLGRLFTLGFSQEHYYQGYYYYMTPIQQAAHSNKPEIIQMLLQRGVNINAPAHDDGFTALQAALSSCHMHVAMNLLRAGANVNAPGSGIRGKPALHYAVASGNTQIVSNLLKAGADANATTTSTSGGTTALHEAASGGHLQIAMELIRAGANINAPAVDIYGGTVLEAAARKGRLDMVHFLLRSNRDKSLLRKDCRRASQKARSHCHTVIARLLDEHAQKLAEELGVEGEDDIDKSNKGSED